MGIFNFGKAQWAKIKAEFNTGQTKTFKQKRKEISNEWRNRNKDK